MSSTCYKEQYKSRSRAEREAKRRMRFHPCCPPLRVYECIFCRRWHLTSQKNRRP